MSTQVNDKSIILAIDAATEACSVALRYQQQLFHLFELCPQQHSQRILPMVDDVLKQAGIKLADVDCIAYSTGPGSFTGVRIGVSVAQGLAFGADVPMVAVSTLQTMAQGAVRLCAADNISVAIDARMGEIYCNEYRNVDGLAQAVNADQVIAPEQAEFSLTGKSYFVGTGWQTYLSQLQAKLPQAVDSQHLYPDAQDMLPLAQVALAARESHLAEEAQPVYVRDTVTWKKLPGRE